ncbi:MAG: type II toxin-antitoxin system prevent-host-death family antitoxin [Blastochloris sp.]|nr:type II toxin-antitoxin system prevent-host-death family antitoxin [Blastochloris sp.]
MKIQEIGIFESKTHLSELLEKVQKEGVTYRITKRGKPVAELRPLGEPVKSLRPKCGYGKDLPGRYYMAPDFNDPLEDFKDYM